MTPRHSHLSIVLFRLNVAGEDSVLLLRHPKWGDWGLVGGHIERLERPHEAALREAGEELAPLAVDRDVAVRATPLGCLAWGPIESVSAKGASTTYTAWFFAGSFLRDPDAILSLVPQGELAYVPVAQLDVHHWPAGVTDMLARFAAQPGGLDQLPLAWADSVSGQTLVDVCKRPADARDVSALVRTTRAECATA